MKKKIFILHVKCLNYIFLQRFADSVPNALMDLYIAIKFSADNYNLQKLVWDFLHIGKQWLNLISDKAVEKINGKELR
jgi:hypothetical protein